MESIALQESLSEEDSSFEACAWETMRNSRLLRERQYIQHGNTSTLQHSIAVAYFTRMAARFFRIPVRERELIRGALLHDYFLYDWHERDASHRLHGLHHPKRALENAQQDFQLSEVEKDIIRKHMFPLTIIPPRYKESLLVCLVDKACSLYEVFRPDAYRKLRRKFAQTLGLESDGKSPAA